jgi:hypothetical protein
MTHSYRKNPTRTRKNNIRTGKTPPDHKNSPTHTGKNHTPVRKNSTCTGKTPTVAEKTHPDKKKLQEFENPFC